MLLLDNSAWARLDLDGLEAERREWVAERLLAGRLGVCLPFLLEAGYSARSGPDHRALMRHLRTLQHIEIDGEVEELALSAQDELAATGHHRVPPSDVVIAACAHHAAAGVLHYDADFDVIAQRTSLDFSSEWLAPRGSL